MPSDKEGSLILWRVVVVGNGVVVVVSVVVVDVVVGVVVVWVVVVGLVVVGVVVVEVVVWVVVTVDGTVVELVVSTISKSPLSFESILTVKNSRVL